MTYEIEITRNNVTPAKFLQKFDLRAKRKVLILALSLSNS